MTNLNFDPAQVYEAKKSLISRLNQDNTVIIMKTDNTEIFYKINGVAALIWNLFKSPASPAQILAAVTAQFPQVSPEQIKDDFNSFMNKIVGLELLDKVNTPVPSNKIEEIKSNLNKLNSYVFGAITDYSLAQIEAEVLNESIYLDVFAGSDLRLKKEVAPLQNSLDKVLALDGISYLWNEKAAATAPQNTQIGLVAQQVVSVMPDLVKKDIATGNLAINYTKITPYLVESIKELKNIIDSQEKRISQLENEIKNLKH